MRVKLDGASEVEIAEAVAVAAIVRHWSTVLNGALVDEPGFRKDVDQIVKNVRAAAGKRAKAAATTAAKSGAKTAGK